MSTVYYPLLGTYGPDIPYDDRNGQDWSDEELGLEAPKQRKQMQITFTGFESEYVKTAKGGYKKAKISFVKEDGSRGSQFIVDYANPQVFKTLAQASEGDVFDVTITQNAKGYDEWAKLVAGGATSGSSAHRASDAAPAAAKAAGTGKVLGSTYETPIERAVKQRLIVRQSSLSNAIELLTTGAKAPPPLEEVFGLAEKLFDFVYQPQEALSETNSFDSIKEDIPF